MSKTSNAVKDRYNRKTYHKYTFYLRQDEQLDVVLQDAAKDKSVSEVVRNALRYYFLKKD